MPDLFARVRQELAAVGSAPITFLVMVLAAGVIMWSLIQWSYSALLAGRDTEIAFLERRLGDWRDKMSGMSPDEAKARLQALETQVKALQIRLQPRRLTEETRQPLVDRARLPPGQQFSLTVLREADCSDCEAFAGQIVAALRESSGWTVSLGVLPETVDKPRYGLAIRVADLLQPPPEAVRLQGALQAARIPFEMIAGGVGSGVELMVTERPVR